MCKMVRLLRVCYTSKVVQCRSIKFDKNVNLTALNKFTKFDFIKFRCFKFVTFSNWPKYTNIAVLDVRLPAVWCLSWPKEQIYKRNPKSLETHFSEGKPIKYIRDEILPS